MYTKEQGLYVAHGPNGPISICGKMANRHGLIAGVICVRRKYLNLDEKNVHKMLNRN